MKKLTTFIFLSMTTLNAMAQGGSEIYLFDLKVSKDNVTITNAKNITTRIGYDNQPSFHPEQPILYYTSADTAGLTDIVAFNYKTGEAKKFTTTPDREYSPTVTPDKKYISCIIQRADGKQDLGKYPMEGGAPILIVDALTVGYHAWADQGNLILFVLGEQNTLRWFSVEDKKDIVLAENIGRSLHVIPGSNDLSFVQKTKDGAWLIRKIEAKDRNISTLTETLPGREDLTWTPDGRIIMSDGEKLFYFQPGNKASWKEIPTNSSLPLKGITRLSVNKKGDKIAIVIAE